MGDLADVYLPCGGCAAPLIQTGTGRFETAGLSMFTDRAHCPAGDRHFPAVRPGELPPPGLAGLADVAEGFPAGGWKFTEEVADAFPAHVRASVPYYDQMQDLVAELTDWLTPAGGLVADLGCSTGHTCALIHRRHPERRLRFAMYDESKPMLEHAAAELGETGAEFHAQRLQDPLQHSGADLTLLLFVLQFLPMTDRVAVLRAARNCAADTGALIIAEKTRPRDARWAEYAADVSHDWKARHGLSDTAIRAKAASLRGVLIPWPLTQTMRMITDCGWRSPEVLFRWHSWVVIGAFSTGDALT